MELVRIQSRNNEAVKLFCKLSESRKARRESGRFTLEGLRLCADCAQSGFTVETLFLTEAAKEKGGERVETLLSSAKTAYCISESVAEKLSDTVTTQGVFSIVQMPENTEFTVEKGGRYLALEQVQNPQNLGAAARTAEALGISGLIVSGGCDRFNPKALRASMGSLLRLPVMQVEDLASWLKAQNETILTLATVPDTRATSICTLDFSGGAIAVVGNEGNGVSEAVLSAVRERVTIPMRGAAESLNASAAATITMWEMMR